MNSCFAIAIDGTHVFVASRTGHLSRVTKAPGSSPVPLDSVSGTNGTDPVHIALFQNRVYWTHWIGPSSGGIRSVNKDGSNLVTFTDAHPEGFATDGTDAYWATSYSPGSIRKGDASLSAAADWVKGQARPRGVALDATHVYWVNFDDRTARRAPR